jgi:excisionase family DNA binding protein
MRRMRTVVDPERLATALGISVRSVYRMVEQNQLPHYRVGRQVRFDLDEVLGLMRREREVVG